MQLQGTHVEAPHVRRGPLSRSFERGEHFVKARFQLLQARTCCPGAPFAHRVVVVVPAAARELLCGGRGLWPQQSDLSVCDRKLRAAVSTCTSVAHSRRADGAFKRGMPGATTQAAAAAAAAAAAERGVGAGRRSDTIITSIHWIKPNH
eukprot:scaffold4020_cov391-Prasinococcus_capsulatus_cf.AAC.3